MCRKTYRLCAPCKSYASEVSVVAQSSGTSRKAVVRTHTLSFMMPPGGSLDSKPLILSSMGQLVTNALALPFCIVLMLGGSFKIRRNVGTEIQTRLNRSLLVFPQLYDCLSTRCLLRCTTLCHGHYDLLYHQEEHTHINSGA